MEPLELLKLIPELDDAAIVFPAGPDIENAYGALTPIALKWQDENPLSDGARFFSTLFYKGGNIPPAKRIAGMTEEDAVRVLRFVRAAMGSYYPKHEHKEAVCSMLWEVFFHLEPPAESK